MCLLLLQSLDLWYEQIICTHSLPPNILKFRRSGDDQILFYLQVDELQNTIEDEQKSLAEELRVAMEEQKISLEDATGGTEAMAID